MKTPLVCSIAGVDSSGGAGIAADLRTLQSFAVQGYSVITAVTAQNQDNISATEYVSAEHITQQLRLLAKPAVLKIGMVGSSAAIDRILAFLERSTAQVVLDPVIRSSSGISLHQGSIEQHRADLIKLFPQITLVTPNIHEAEILVGRSLQNCADMEWAARNILHLGVKSVLIKGGHSPDRQFSQDYWTNGEDAFWLSGPRYTNHSSYRGTGCTLSSAISACLALGYDIKDALVIAVMYTRRGIRLAQPVGGSAVLYHGGWPEEQCDLPWLSCAPLQQTPLRFQPCPIGLYPVVDSFAWLKKLLPLNIRDFQLRLKEPDRMRDRQIQSGIAEARKYAARLFINDHWEAAIRYGAFGVHLGQEDLQNADIEKIYRHGLRLGISTHCWSEVARAHGCNPSYIACGPIFTTTSKIMPFKPQGIAALKRWQRTLDYPLVAIGGINHSNIDSILSTGVKGVAFISAITKATDPLFAARQLIATTLEKDTEHA